MMGVGRLSHDFNCRVGPDLIPPIATYRSVGKRTGFPYPSETADTPSNRGTISCAIAKAD